MTTVAEPAFTVAEGPRPDGVARIVALHGAYYAREWGFGPFFTDKVGREADAFFVRYDPARDRAWFVLHEGTVVGSMVIDGEDAAGAGAHLRWFILDDVCRGQGLGADLMARAMAFSDARGYANTYLTTFAGLDAARALYERHGFVLVDEKEDRTWGDVVKEQRFERRRIRER